MSILQLFLVAFIFLNIIIVQAVPFAQDEFDRLKTVYNGLGCAAGSDCVFKDITSDFDCPITSADLQCNASGFIHRLQMEFESLNGSLVSEIALLTALQELNLANNHLIGTIPSELRSMKQLKRIVLRNNSFVGTFPTIYPDICELYNANTNDTNCFTSCQAPVCDCDSVHKCVGGSTKFAPGEYDRLQSVLQKLGCLTSLACPIKAIQAHHDCPTLDGEGVECDAFGFVVELRMRQNQLSGTLPTELALLSRLRNLELRRNGIRLSGTVPTELFLLTQLSALYLNDNAISGELPSLIGLLTNLKFLYLNANDMQSTLPTELGELTELDTVYMSGGMFHGTVPSELGRWTKAKTLDLRTNKLIGTLPTELGLMTRLFQIYFYKNLLNGTIPNEVAALSLNQLNLGSNSLSGTIPTNWGYGLDTLFLSDNQLSGTIPSSLGTQPRLKQLILNNNHLTGFLPTELSLSTTLTSLSVFYNFLNGSVPALPLVTSCDLYGAAAINCFESCTVAACDCEQAPASCVTVPPTPAPNPTPATTTLSTSAAVTTTMGAIDSSSTTSTTSNTTSRATSLSTTSFSLPSPTRTPKPTPPTPKPTPAPTPPTPKPTPAPTPPPGAECKEYQTCDQCIDKLLTIRTCKWCIDDEMNTYCNENLCGTTSTNIPICPTEPPTPPPFISSSVTTMANKTSTASSTVQLQTKTDVSSTTPTINAVDNSSTEGVPLIYVIIISVVAGLCFLIMFGVIVCLVLRSKNDKSSPTTTQPTTTTSSSIKNQANAENNTQNHEYAKIAFSGGGERGSDYDMITVNSSTSAGISSHYSGLIDVDQEQQVPEHYGHVDQQHYSTISDVEPQIPEHYGAV